MKQIRTLGSATPSAAASRSIGAEVPPVRRALCLVLASSGCLGGGAALAADATVLPTVTVQGQAVTSTAERLQREQARDVRDVLGREANVDIGGGVRQGQRLYLRGVEGSNVNITVDGARQGQNLYNHRGGLGNIDPDILKLVEVNAGPAAADDGPGALGGSIRMETVDAQDLLAPGQQVGARVRAGYASANRGKRASASAYGLVAPGVGVLAHVSRDHYDDLRTGDGRRTPFSGGRDDGHLLKLSLLEMGAHQLRVGSERQKASGLNFQQRGDYPWQFQPDPAVRPPVDQTLVREQHTLNYRFNPDSDWLDVELRLYQSSNDWAGKTPTGLVERFVSDGWGTDVRNRMRYGVGGLAGTLTVGVDRYEDKGVNKRSDRADRRNANESRGVYLQNRLTAAAGDVWFGVRHDEFDSSFRDGSTRASSDATSFNVGGEARLGHGVSVFGGYGEAASGAGTIPVHFAGNVVTGGALLNGRVNGTLKAERSHQTEAGVRWQQGSPAGNGLMRLEGLVFENRIEDAILYRQPGSGGLGGRNVTEFYNAASTATFKGVELRAAYAAGPFNADFSFMHLDVANLPNQAQFLARFGAPHGDKAVLRFGYAFSDNLQLGYTLTAVARLKDVPPAQTVYIEKSGYATHDVSVNWQPAGMKGLSVDFAVHNLLDKRYSKHSTLSEGGLSTLDAGRDIRVGLRYAF